MNVREHEVSISIEPRLAIAGTLWLPDRPLGVVVQAQGTARARKQERERLVASVLERAGFATLLLDLLTTREEESSGHRLRSDVPLLAGRLILTMLWLRRQPETHELPVGLFGAGTAAAAALVAAAHESDRVRAIATRGGRPELAGDNLREVRAPTLLIVGGADVPVLAATRAALPRLPCTKQLELIPGAAHLFEQSGALELAAFRARDWFARYLSFPSSAREPPSSVRRSERVQLAGSRR